MKPPRPKISVHDRTVLHNSLITLAEVFEGYLGNKIRQIAHSYFIAAERNELVHAKHRKLKHFNDDLARVLIDLHDWEDKNKEVLARVSYQEIKDKTFNFNNALENFRRER